MKSGCYFCIKTPIDIPWSPLNIYKYTSQRHFFFFLTASTSLDVIILEAFLRLDLKGTSVEREKEKEKKGFENMGETSLHNTCVNELNSESMGKLVKKLLI